MAVNDVVQSGVGMFSGTFDKLGSIGWIFIVIAVLAILGTIGYFLVQFKKTKGQWSQRVRIRQEDTLTHKFPIDAVTVKGRYITLSNGLKGIYLETPILGHRIFPRLNYYTKPNYYDVLLTADRRIFIATGIEGLDKVRKQLNVGVRYPGIDVDFDELNADYKRLNQQDKKNTFLEFAKVAVIGITAICLLLGLIFGGKYWVDGKEFDAQTARAQAEVFEQMKLSAEATTETLAGLELLIPRLEQLYGTKNLQNQIEINKRANG